MKRRDFLRTAGAAAVLPVMPLPAMAAPAASTPVNAMQVGWAALYARVNNHTTPALLQKWLRVSPDQAQALMSELVERRILHAPTAGSAAAINPMYGGPNMNGLFGRTSKVVEQTRDLVEKFSDKLPSQSADDTSMADTTEPKAQNTTTPTNETADETS